MRLFTAVIFDEETKEKVYRIEEALRSGSKRGSFTAKDNLHLTVNFIGETKRLEEVKQAMNQAAQRIHKNGFMLMIKGFGRFKRREGDIYWIGVEKVDTLLQLQKQLVEELKNAGFFEIDDNEYTPHLTIGRRVLVNDDFNTREFEAEIKPIYMKVDRISLMKSERLEGKLVYTEIYNVKLNEDPE